MNATDQIDLNTKIVKQDEVIASELEGETIMMSLEQEKYYSLNLVGSRIWELLDQPRSIIEICDLLLLEYDVDIETCRREVKAVVQHLIEERLVGVIDG